MNIFRSLVAAVFLGSALVLATCLSAFADEWQAVKLRGSVFVFVDDAWAQLERGDLVPDNRVIRTAPKSRVQFMRGEETIDLGPDTQIRIFDRVGQEFTIVQEHFGEVAVEVERRNVQHFAIQTQFLVAVVKGTRFTVNADVNGAKVSVLRGQVEVRDVARKLTVDVTPGQHASVGEAESLTISGPGTLAPIVAYAGDPLAAEVATVAEGVTVTTTGTPAATNVIGTPAASVVAKTPAATKTTVTTTTIDIVTPAVANTVDTPAADVVANTPAATNSPPAHSNAGGKNK